MYVPLRAVSLDHMYIHSHGSLYPMMDYTLHVYYGLLTVEVAAGRIGLAHSVRSCIERESKLLAWHTA